MTIQTRLVRLVAALRLNRASTASRLPAWTHTGTCPYCWPRGAL